MPGFESIIDQHRPVKVLRSLLKRGDIPHAILLTGIDGIGKRTAAVLFAMACNCTGAEESTGAGYPPDPCGTCRSCRKIEAQSHPDVLRIEPEGPILRIHQIRELIGILAMKPYEARLRVVILSDAHTLNPEAGNALLKVLEEPPDRTILILTAPQTSDLMPTIVSRCQHFRFNPLSREGIVRLLEEKLGIDPEAAGILAAMSGGSLARALAMNDGGWIRRRSWLVEETGRLADRPIDTVLAFAEILSRDRNVLDGCLEVLLGWYRDLAVWRFSPGRIVHKDLAGRIEEVAETMETDRILACIDAVQAARETLRNHGNPRLTLELMALELGGAKSASVPKERPGAGG